MNPQLKPVLPISSPPRDRSQSRENAEDENRESPSSQAYLVELIRYELLEPAVWQRCLEQYAYATNLAVALVNAHGNLIGECLNPHPLWILLGKRKTAVPSPCPFSLDGCTCIAEALKKGKPAFARDRSGLVHFAVPLALSGHPLGAVIAGQVFDRYPESLGLDQIASRSEVSPQAVRQLARQEHPFSRAALKAYSELLATLAGAFLEARYHSIIEANRLSGMMRLRDAEQAARREAEMASRDKDNFLAMVSHELRTPLSVVLGYSQVLSSRDLEEADRTQAIEAIQRNAKSQKQLIGDLLDSSRIISGKLHLDVRVVEAPALIQASVEDVRPAAEAKHIEIQLAVGPERMLVQVDPGRVKQVVGNVLSNAIKFTPEGGRIEVRLESVESHVQLTVSDTGIGIAPEFLPHVFDHFRQASSGSTRLYGGLGLGLAIVRQLVELHGGTVRVDSPGLGRGATLTIQLPVAELQEGGDLRRQAAAAKIAPALNQKNDTLHGVRVLVVDDEFDTRELLALVLTRCGARVVTAESASKALEQVDRFHPDILVCDIAMPGEDGYELIRKVRVREAQEGGKTPALAVTAYASTEDRSLALAAGFQMHMAKPVEPDELASAVATLVGSCCG